MLVVVHHRTTTLARGGVTMVFPAVGVCSWGFVRLGFLAVGVSCGWGFVAVRPMVTAALVWARSTMATSCRANHHVEPEVNDISRG